MPKCLFKRLPDVIYRNNFYHVMPKCLFKRLPDVICKIIPCVFFAEIWPEKITSRDGCVLLNLGHTLLEPCRTAIRFRGHKLLLTDSTNRILGLNCKLFWWVHWAEIEFESSSFLLTTGSFLLTIELLCLQRCLGALLLTIETSLVAIGVFTYN